MDCGRRTHMHVCTAAAAAAAVWVDFFLTQDSLLSRLGFLMRRFLNAAPRLYAPRRFPRGDKRCRRDEHPPCDGPSLHSPLLCHLPSSTIVVPACKNQSEGADRWHFLWHHCPLCYLLVRESSHQSASAEKHKCQVMFLRCKKNTCEPSNGSE